MVCGVGMDGVWCGYEWCVVWVWMVCGVGMNGVWCGIWMVCGVVVWGTGKGLLQES